MPAAESWAPPIHLEADGLKRRPAEDADGDLHGLCGRGDAEDPSAKKHFPLTELPVDQIAGGQLYSLPALVRDTVDRSIGCQGTTPVSVVDDGPMLDDDVRANPF